MHAVLTVLLDVILLHPPTVKTSCPRRSKHKRELVINTSPKSRKTLSIE
uniref:Uncharacterized protein n=1 Tax=Rhizophora mucronata TaxID=61149 RepID=A0A2P2QDM4_RHIMU